MTPCCEQLRYRGSVYYGSVRTRARWGIVETQEAFQFDDVALRIGQLRERPFAIGRQSQFLSAALDGDG